jgi:acetyl esterase/lipase
MGRRVWPLAAVCALVATVAAAEPEPLILAHCMPWYGSREGSGQWGWHWTMDHFDPEEILWEGKREAASHDYPLIGLYDSGDPDALECQVLQMKFAGLDGVIIDWYGTGAYHDSARNHENARRMVDQIRKAGMRFAICYEDQALGQMVRGKALSEAGAVNQAKQDLQWAQENWFKDSAYVRLDERPLLLVFGPQHLGAEAWREVRSALSPEPLLHGLPHLSQRTGMDGAFAWVPVSGGKTVPPETWRKELDPAEAGYRSAVAVVFPGFNDIYQRAGLHESYGRIDDRDGATFTETLGRALKGNSRVVQVATWNDYGEGTVIEPAWNNGYRFVEALQKSRPGGRFAPSDLRLPAELYQLRKRSGPKADLDRAAELLFAGKTGEAVRLLATVRRKLEEGPAVFAETPDRSDAEYRLKTEIEYREGEPRCRLDVYFPARRQGFPTVVWFHGGGLSKGNRSVPIPLRRQGVAVVAVNYRLVPEHASPAFLEDAAAAVAWTFGQIGDLGGSVDKIFVSGHSAGAYLSAMIGLDRKWLGAHGIDANRIAGLVPLSPQAITHFAVRKEKGIGQNQPVVDALAPLFHVRGDAPPILLVTGDRELELAGRYEENAYLWRMLKLNGHRDVVLRELQGFDHGKMAEPALPLLLEFVRKRAGSSD